MKIERAAGGVVFRKGPNGPEVLLIDDAYGHVTFPKGHVEQGETWEEAAIREIREETGIEARILAPLGRVEYRIERDGAPVRKQVRLFVLEEIDEADEPVAQVEEIRGAYFVPLDRARELTGAKGYANWSWALNKAVLLHDWHEGHWEERWRALPTTSADADGVWSDVVSLVERLVWAVYDELSVVAPDVFARLAPLELPRLPLPGPFGSAELRRAVEHTLLRPDASVLEIERLCGEARQHGFHAACVNPLHVETARSVLAGSAVEVCSVVGFPLGSSQPQSIAHEAVAAVQAGAREIDMVLPVGAMKEDDIWTVYDHIRAVCDAVKGEPGVIVKVILETHYLSYSQVVMASAVAAAAGADFVKTSTGFAPTGARVADVAAMFLATGGRLGVKASGGVRSRADAAQFMRYGASRIGTSSGPAIVRE